MRDYSQVAAETWNTWMRAVRARMTLVLGSGLRQEATPAGRSLSTDPRDPHFLACIVSGSGGGPYRFRKVVPDGTGWRALRDVDDPRVAYQANLQATPLMRIVRMHEVGLAGEVRFWRPRGGVMGEVDTECCAGTPLPATVYVHDIHGVHAATFVDEDPLGVDYLGPSWEVCYTLSSIAFDRVGVGTVDDPAPILSTTKDVALRWVVQCLDEGDAWTGHAQLWTWELFNPPSEPGAVPGFGLPFASNCAGPLGYTVDGNTYNGQETINARLATVCATCSPLGLEFQTTFDAGITLAYVYGFDPYITAGVGILTWFVTDTADPPDVTVDVIATVTRCVAGVTTAVSGATADLYELGGMTPVATGTTDGSGEVTLAAVHGGAHSLVVTESGCTATVPVMVGICGLDVEVPVDLCCGRVRLTLKDRINDDPLVGASVYAPVGAHRFPDGTPWTTDGSGQVTITLTAAETASLPRSSGCTPRLRVTALAADYLRACIDVDLACTGAAPDEDFFLDPLDTDHDSSLDYISGEPVCEDTAGCSVPGYANRGLVGYRPHVVFQAEVLGTDSVWYDITGESGTKVFVFDPGVLSGTPSGSPWEDNPYSLTSPDIEYAWTDTSSFSPPPEVTGGVTCLQPFGSISVWLRRGTGSSSGMIVRLHGFGVGQVTIPGLSTVGCAEELESMDLRMPFSFEPCILAEPWDFDSGWITVPGGAGSLNYRYRVQGTL